MTRTTAIFTTAIFTTTIFTIAAWLTTAAVGRGAPDRSARAAERKPAPQKPAECALQIDLPKRMEAGSYKPARISIKNTGGADVTLVMPGDGSDCAWRTPLVGWSVLPADSTDKHPTKPPRRGGARCGNVNPLRSAEVFTLKPGQSASIGEWAGYPVTQKPGDYRVVFYYSNVPQMKWSGLPLGKHDPKAMKLVRSSTPVALRSNEVMVTVVPKAK